MSYERFVDDVVKGVEALGAAIMVVGGTVALLGYALGVLRRDGHRPTYEELRRRLGRAILIGLEVLIIGDIVRTIVVDPTLESVTVLGAIVIIRILLSFALEVEIDGTWPWSRWRREQAAGAPVGGPND
ncbi:MAG: DUF1622 domain-containing protein [Acidimicrobiales bacterium]|nr:DUF1622 domain-containing protein [Acidimicrobiales bacterium]